MPLSAADATAAQASPAHTGDTPSGSCSVLVVDDNRDAAESLSMLLRLLGAHVTIATSGPEALVVVGECKPAVVLLDLGMPGMDGYEVARRLRADPQHRDVMIVALTGWGQEEDRRRTGQAGFDLHLTKPTDVGTLQSLLASLGHAAAA